jgi:type I restriction enzyme S subunit
MSEWKEYKLNDLITKLGDGLHGTPKYDSNGDYYFINGSNLIGGRISVNDNTKKVSKEEFEKYKKELTDRTIFVSINGTLGNIATYNNEKVVLGKSACYFNVRDDVSKEFVKYIVTDKSFQHYIFEYATGSTIKNVPLKAIREFSFKLPSLPTQTAIAEILSSLDDKIELNNKINQELETLAQTLFKRWFIDFEFPNENGESYKTSGGEMVESELGEIPMGWEVAVLSDATKLIRGISYRKPELVSKEDGIAFVNLKCFSLNGTFRQNGIKYYNGKFKNEQILCNNDILVAVTDLTQDREIIGMPILWNGITTALPSLDTCIIRSENSELKNYLYYEFKTNRYKSRIIEHANGSTVLHLSVKGLETYVFPLPSKEILKKWCLIIQPILETISSNINEVNELSVTRDTLLPKLISGELEITSK